MECGIACKMMCERKLVCSFWNERLNRRLQRVNIWVSEREKDEWGKRKKKNLWQNMRERERERMKEWKGKGKKTTYTEKFKLKPTGNNDDTWCAPILCYFIGLCMLRTFNRERIERDFRLFTQRENTWTPLMRIHFGAEIKWKSSNNNNNNGKRYKESERRSKSVMNENDIPVVLSRNGYGQKHKHALSVLDASSGILAWSCVADHTLNIHTHTANR